MSRQGIDCVRQAPCNAVPKLSSSTWIRPNPRYDLRCKFHHLWSNSACLELTMKRLHYLTSQRDLLGCRGTPNISFLVLQPENSTRMGSILWIQNAHSKPVFALDYTEYLVTKDGSKKELFSVPPSGQSSRKLIAMAVKRHSYFPCLKKKYPGLTVVIISTKSPAAFT